MILSPHAHFTAIINDKTALSGEGDYKVEGRKVTVTFSRQERSTFIYLHEYNKDMQHGVYYKLFNF